MNSLLRHSLFTLVIGLALGFAGLTSSAQSVPAALPNLKISSQGVIHAMVAQPDGKVVIGGDFSSVNGVPRLNLARLNPNGTLDRSWRADVDGDVRALAANGRDIYVGGFIFSVNGQNASSPAKVNSRDGSLDQNWKPNVDGFVNCLALSGNALYVGGSFRKARGVPRRNLARVSANGTGAADPSWNPSPSGGSVDGVYAVVVHGDSVYVGGGFRQIGGLALRNLAKVSVATGTVDPLWNPNPDDEVDYLAIGHGGLYVNGFFSRIGGQRRDFLARLALSGAGAADAWHPRAILLGPVAVDGPFVYVGDVLDGARRLRASNATGDGSWKPATAGSVEALLVRGEKVLLGGDLKTSGAAFSLGLARVQVATGAIDEARPTRVERSGSVQALARQSDGKLIFGGSFDVVDGLLRSNLARLNADGSVDPTWNLGASENFSSGSVSSLAIRETTLFVAGSFDRIGGVSRGNIAKLSTQGGGAVDQLWKPPATTSRFISAIALQGDSLYATYTFGNFLAKLSADGEGAADPAWQPPALEPNPQINEFSPVINALATDGEHVFVGGAFRVAGTDLVNLAKFDPITGAADLAFQVRPALPYGQIRSGIRVLELAGSSLFVGGDFSNVTGQNPRNVAKLDAVSGQIDPLWRPEIAADENLASLEVDGGQVYLGMEKNVEVDRGDSPKFLRIIRADADSGILDPQWNHTVTRTTTSSIFSTLASIRAFSIQNGDVFVAGEFSQVDGEARAGLAFLPGLDAPSLSQDGIRVIVLPANTDLNQATHFQIAAIAGGSLRKPDGAPVSSGDFITAEEGRAGLNFVFPDEATEAGAVTAIASLNATATGLGRVATTLPIDPNKAQAVFTLDRDSLSIDEGAGTATLAVLKTGGASGEVTLTIADASAVAGIDFLADPAVARLSFTAEETSRTVTIPLIDDTLFKGDRIFRVSVSAPSLGAVLGGPALATVTIVENDFVGTADPFTGIALPTSAPAATGTLSIQLDPRAIRGQWKLLGELTWRDSGLTLGGLATGNYTVLFKPITNYLEPDPLIVPVVAGAAAVFSAAYEALATPQFGSLAVEIQPAAVALETDPLRRGQWRREGEAAWHEPGEVLTGLNAGVYTIEFKPVPGFDAPRPLAVFVAGDDSGTVINRAVGTYYVADVSPGAAPEPLDAPTTTGQAPYLFNGQIESAVGSGSGVVVKERVVLTVAHALFDDIALSYVNGVRWLFQRARGTYEPAPVAARGWYVFEGYAGQRGVDQSPGISSANSQNLDAAAVYFLQLAGRGGFGGYLSSDAAANEWLTGSAEKMLAGYPVEVVPEADRGKLHATPPTTAPLTPLYPADPLKRVFTTTAIKGHGGMSGGPLYVFHDPTDDGLANGAWYPAGVFLGGTAQTVVRAIDSQVVELISRAEVSANNGTNSVGGGITTVSPGITANIFAPARISVIIEPAAARVAGARWRLKDETVFFPSETVLTQASGNYIIEFRDIAGFFRPAERQVIASDRQTSQFTGTYTAVPNVTVRTESRPANGGATSGGNFPVGLPATAIAQPALGFRFLHWAEGKNSVSTATSYAFPAARDRALVAHFKAGPFVARQGVYRALAAAAEFSPESSGTIRLSLNAAGRFTATLRVAGKSYAFSGGFGPDGHFTKTLRVAGGQTLTLDLTLDLKGQPANLTGSATLGAGPRIEFLASREAFDGTTRRAPQRGRYTFAIRAEPATSDLGHSYGTLNVDAAGAVELQGFFADGRAFREQTTLLENGTALLVTPARSGPTQFVGPLAFTSAAEGGYVIDGALHWIQATGSSVPNGAATFTGSRYRSPGLGEKVLDLPDQIGGNALLRLSSGGEILFAQLCVLAAGDELTVLGRDELTITLSLRDGLFQGRFPDPITGTPRDFGGALLQQQKVGAGLFQLDGGKTGLVELIAAP